MAQVTEGEEFGSLELPLRRLGQAIEQAERELSCLRRAYLEAARRTVDLATESPPFGRAAALSRQEVRVLALVAEGRTNCEIATTLNVSVHTVKSHVQNILRKRSARSRWQLVRPLPLRP